MGKKLEGIKICNYDELVSFCEQREHVNIVLTSIYGKEIVNKLQNISNISIFQMYNWYADLIAAKEGAIETRCRGKRLEKFKDNIEALKVKLEDDESEKVLDAVYTYFLTDSVDEIINVCVNEGCYFTKEVLDYFGDKKVAVVDGGAYDGELLRGMQKANIRAKEWYCFELSKANFEKLEANVSYNNGGIEKICLENKGLWKICDKLPIQGQEVVSKVNEGSAVNENAELAELTTIDCYFSDKKIDMIKMDIEGAETNALLGGLNVIKRDRPVLAISIYHSPEDYYTIPQLLMKELENYKYYIRQHATFYGATVLYAIPC